MSDQTMTERVARAIEGTMFAPHELPVCPELHAKYLVTARAAIEAMREPTDRIAREMAGYTDFVFSSQIPDMPAQIEEMKIAWAAGIDAALSDPRPSP